MTDSESGLTEGEFSVGIVSCEYRRPLYENRALPPVNSVPLGNGDPVHTSPSLDLAPSSNSWITFLACSFAGNRCPAWIVMVAIAK